MLAQFRNDYYPRIAVTVDMIASEPMSAAGMPAVYARCEKPQLLRTDERPWHPYAGRRQLEEVTPSAATAKTHYVIVDAIGVTHSLKTAG
ncbi:MAG: hypothetical protein R3F37_08610 [Candidatus Competibacteraceae bacterium]